MDRIEQYRQIIQRILAEYLKYIPKEENIETVGIQDVQSDNYLLLDMGWQPPRRIYAVILHLRINDGKIWIEQDGTEDGVAHELLKAGVLPDEIVLGFQLPDMRHYAQELLTVL